VQQPQPPIRDACGRRGAEGASAYIALQSDDDGLIDDASGHAFQRFELFHRMVRFVFGNKIYVGPVEKVLSADRDTAGERLRVLDMGTGGGLW
jgi:methylase of polypeptide subunit release factors